MRFLESLAQKLLETGTDLRDVAVVLPSHRAGVHLRKYLAQANGGPLWSPDLTEPSGFMSRIAGFRLFDATEAVLRLYKTYEQMVGAQIEPLSEFVAWAPPTLSDFSDADGHLLDLDVLYRDLRSYHELEAWSFLEAKPLSSAQKMEMERWQRMGQLHRAFDKECRSMRAGHHGLIARVAAERVSQAAWRSPWKHVWFAGLNAMDPALMAVADALKNQGLSHFAWDADRYYLDDERNAAGRFLRRSIARLGEGSVPLKDLVRMESRRIDAVAVPDEAAMSRFASQWAAELAPSDRDQAVIILADENLLMPMLECFPAEIAPLNVTMGIALKDLPGSTLERSWFNLLEHADEAGRFLRTDFEALITHPYLHESQSTLDVLKRISGRTTSLEEIRTASVGLSAQRAMLDALVPSTRVTAHSHRLEALHAWAAQARSGDSLAQESLFTMARSREVFDRSCITILGGIPDIRSYATMRLRDLQRDKLPLHGEPLKGLQVMGMLETRALDHAHVLILGASEGSLSGLEPPASWIPNQIRQRFGLPASTDAEAIISYHVHRLLHSAKRITLAHVSNDQGAERSRFVTMWQHAFAENESTQMADHAVSAPVAARSGLAISVAKSPAVMRQLQAMASKGFSPTALGHWLRCPLDFHARYMLGLREAEMNDGQLAMNHIGSAVHATLETMLRPKLGTRLTPGFIGRARAEAHALLMEHLIKSGHPPDTLTTGRNRLVIEMAVHGLCRFLEQEERRVQEEETIVLDVEKRHSALMANGARLAGTIDRIDMRSGMCCVLDIKTGKADPGKLKIDLEDSVVLDASMNMAVQLVCYAILCFGASPELERLQAGLVTLRKPAPQGVHWLLVNGSPIIRRSDLPALENMVQRVMDDIMNPAIPFAHKVDADNCIACA